MLTCMFFFTFFFFSSLPQYPKLFSFGYFSKEGPTPKQVTKGSLKSLYVSTYMCVFIFHEICVRKYFAAQDYSNFTSLMTNKLSFLAKLLAALALVLLTVG